MKKSYMKPEMNEIEVAANQAVATCGVRCVGYDNSWSRGLNGRYGWPTAQQAWDVRDPSENNGIEMNSDPANGLYIFPVYYGETYSEAEQKIVCGTFHDDKVINGVMDAGEYVAWQEGDYNAVAAVLSGNVAAVVAS